MAVVWYLKLIFVLWRQLMSRCTYETKFCTIELMDIPTSFIWIIIFFNKPSAYSDGGILKLLRWIQNLQQSTWDHKILYADRSLEDEQLLIRPLLLESKNMNMACSWMLKFTFYFMDRTREPLRLDKWSFVHWRIMDIHVPTSFILIVIFLWRSFWILRYFEFMRLCWDRRWNTLCIL
jgi:hypothetical protein